MTDKPKFFFEADVKSDEYSLTSQEHADTFFSTLQDTGLIQEAPGYDLEPKSVQADASMKKLETKVLSIEYGVYQGNYAVHVTPTHPGKNLKNENMVKQALKEIVVLLNEYVPPSLDVKIFMPRSDWAMKVMSFVVDGGADVWGLDKAKLEEEGIPRIFEAVEKVIMAS